VKPVVITVAESVATTAQGVQIIWKSWRNEMSKAEKIVEEFITNLQWNLRASYNSSSCLGSKQRDFLKDDLYELVISYEDKINKLKGII